MITRGSLTAFTSFCAILFLSGSVSAQKNNIPAEFYNANSISDLLKENANSVIRYSEKEIIVKSAGKAVIKEHVIQTILNEKDEDDAIFTIFYDRKFSTVNTAEMRVYDSKGILIKRYKKSDFYDRSAVDGMSIITDGRLLIAGHPIVSYPVTVEKVKEVTLNSFLDLFDWDIQGEEVSVQLSKCRVSAKTDVGFRYQLKNLTLQPVKSQDGDYETYSWEIKNLKAIKPEEGSASWSFVPRISFATNVIDFDDLPGDMSTWKAFGNWQYTLNKNSTTLSPKRIEEIKQMVSGLSTDKEKAKFLYEYVQKSTRYVSIQLGIGGLKPFPASFVDEKKYGDCKALSNYMKALLNCVNIPSHYAIVSAGANSEPADPKFVNSPFNHVILCIPFENDTTWLECTSQTATFGKLGSSTENRNALLVTDNGGELANTPKSIKSDYVFNTDVAVSIFSDGSAKAKLNIKTSGDFREMMIALSKGKTDEQKKYLINYLNLKQPDVLDVTQKTDKDGVKEVELDMIYVKLNDIEAGGKYFFRPRIFDLWRYTLPILTQRNTDFYFEHPMEKRCRTVYTLPADLDVESLPADVAISFSSGSYSVKYLFNREKNEIEMLSNFEIAKHVVPASKYHEMQAFMDDIAKSMSKKMVLKKKV